MIVQDIKPTTSVNDIKPTGLVSDVKPSSLVENVKPKLLVRDIKPTTSAYGETETYYNPEATLEVGQSMGLLLAITCPETTTSRSVRR